MYGGRIFVSLKIRPIYSPIIPKAISCTPPKNRITQSKVGNPSTVSPHTIVFTITYSKYIIATNDTTNPNMDEILNGAVVKHVIPSIARFIRPLKLKDDFPSVRSA